MTRPLASASRTRASTCARLILRSPARSDHWSAYGWNCSSIKTVFPHCLACFCKGNAQKGVLPYYGLLAGRMSIFASETPTYSYDPRGGRTYRRDPQRLADAPGRPRSDAGEPTFDRRETSDQASPGPRS